MDRCAAPPEAGFAGREAHYGCSAAAVKRRRKCEALYPCMETMSGMIRIATTFAILIIGLIAGPAVSL
jgi:hypothetical protein